MKSYQDHLNTLLSSTPSSHTHKASAIFPFFTASHLQTKLIFLNYWSLKRDINDICCEIFIRDFRGQLIASKKIQIQTVRAYEISISDWLLPIYPIFGSIEVIFSSQQNLVFPYPGVTLVYSHPSFMSFVHAAQRIYDSKHEPSQNKNVIEAGFNILANDQQFPLITLINGAAALTDEVLRFKAINEQGRSLLLQQKITALPYQTLMLLFKDRLDLQKHLKGRPGTMQIELCNTQTFPRLIVGNYDRALKALSVTHTYYDLSRCDSEKDYWPTNTDQWHPMSLVLPIIEDNECYTQVYFYPIYSPCSFWVDCEIYAKDGKLLKRFDRVKKIEPSKSFQHLNLKPYTLAMSTQSSLSMRLIAYSCDHRPIAARLKVGLNVGYHKSGLPCNVCTNFSPYNPKMLTKSKAFRWAPLMPTQFNGSIWCFNSSNLKNYEQKAHITCSYYRIEDHQKLQEQFTIPPNGHHIIEHTHETEAFFKNSTGWCTFESDNPFITTYYFAKCKNKVIGADHGF